MSKRALESLRQWAVPYVSANGDIDMKDMKSFEDGRGFLAILNRILGAEFPYAPSANPCDNFASAFQEANVRYKVPKVLDASDPECCEDSMCLMLYLNELRERLPPASELRPVDANTGGAADTPAPAPAQDGPSPSFQRARRGSLRQIANGFSNMEASSAAKLKEGVESKDRSAPVISADATLSNEFATARRKSLRQIEDGFVNMDETSAARLKEDTPTDDRSAPQLEEGLAPTHSLANARRESLKQIEHSHNDHARARRSSLGMIANNFAGMDAASANRLNEGAESNDRSAPVLEQKTAPKHDYAKARRNSLNQIANGFANMEAASAARLKDGVETDDRSAPDVSAAAEEGSGFAHAQAHRESLKHIEHSHSDLQRARRNSLKQIEGGFVKMDQGSVSRLREGVSTDDRSAPVIEPDVAPAHEFANARRKSMEGIVSSGGGSGLKNQGVKTSDRSAPVLEVSAEESSDHSFVKARRGSLNQIANSFAGMEDASAARLNEGVETNDRSAPVIPQVDNMVPTMFRPKQVRTVALPGEQPPLPDREGAAESLQSQVSKTIAAKYDSALEEKLQRWIEASTGEPFTAPFAEHLKSGVVLCKLVNVVQPGAVSKISASRFAFAQMENITAFLRACKTLGLDQSSLFDTADLYNQDNMFLVLQCLLRLSNVAAAKGLPSAN